MKNKIVTDGFCFLRNNCKFAWVVASKRKGRYYLDRGV